MKILLLAATRSSRIPLYCYSAWWTTVVLLLLAHGGRRADAAFLNKPTTTTSTPIRTTPALFARPPPKQPTGQQNKFPIPVKPRGSKKAGSPAQKLLQKQQKKQKQGGNDALSISEFDKLKDIAYSVGDGLSGLASKKKTGPPIVDGYAAKTKKSPTQQLLDNVKKRTPSSTTFDDDPKTKKNINKSVKEEPSRSVFDSVKEAVYGTADLATNKSKKTKKKPSPPSSTFSSKLKSPLERLKETSDDDDDNFKPVVKARIEASKEVLDSIPDLQSRNPVKRKIAEWKIRNLEFRENARNKKKQFEDTVDNVKEGIYAVGDFVQNTVVEIQKLPNRIQTLAQQVVSFFVSIPIVVEETVDTIVSIPKKVEEKANNVKQSVTRTVDMTIQVVDDVKAIPTKVQNTAESTKQSVTRTVEKVDEMSTATKVLLGLEKPKPKPPKTPPPPPPKPPMTPQDMAMNVAGTVAKGAGQALWFVGKGAAGLTWKAVSSGASKVKDEATAKIKEQMDKQQTSGAPIAAPKTKAASPIAKTPMVSPPKTTTETKKPTPPKASATTSTETKKPTPPKTTTETSEIKKPEPSKASEGEAAVDQNEKMVEELLDKEVTEALQLAKDALNESKGGGDNEKKKSSTTTTAKSDKAEPTNTNKKGSKEDKKGGKKGDDDKKKS